MKRIIGSNGLRRFGLRQSGLLIASAALAVSGASGWSVPSLAAPKPAIVATKLPLAQSSITESIQALRSSQQRWIEVNLSTQRLIAWEGNKPVHAVIVSTGKASTPTRQGVFSVEAKHRLTRMQGDDYDVPDVPYTMYFSGGYAIHGAYWHHDFGTPVSHGCVNVAVDHASWLFSWASLGTPVIVHQ